MIGKLTGPAHTWEMFDKSRSFGEVTLPFSEAREYVMPQPYNAITRKGQQRDIKEPHARKLKLAMRAGDYAPTPVSAHLEKRHREHLTVKDGVFMVEVDTGDPLLQTDGGHRFEALDRWDKELETAVANEKDEGEKEKLSRWRQQVLNAPVTVTVYFDGNPQKDFCAFQQGMGVDPTQMLSMSIAQKVLADPEYQLAFGVAKLLHMKPGNPFHNIIRFDSRVGNKGSMVKQLSLKTLCAKASSDAGTSLFGLGKVAALYDGKEKVTWLAMAVVSAAEILEKKSPHLLEEGKVLCPVRSGGTKGTATMLIGLAVCLCYRMSVLGEELAGDETLERLVETATACLDQMVEGDMTSGRKRQMLGDFARNYLADLAGEKHGGVPRPLVAVLSPSAFGIKESLPKEKKGVGAKSASNE